MFSHSYEKDRVRKSPSMAESQQSPSLWSRKIDDLWLLGPQGQFRHRHSPDMGKAADKFLPFAKTHNKNCPVINGHCGSAKGDEIG